VPSAPWGGRRPRLADYVMETGPHGGRPLLEGVRVGYAQHDGPARAILAPGGPGVTNFDFGMDGET
jgi:hypothetical protein